MPTLQRTDEKPATTRRRSPVKYAARAGALVAALGLAGLVQDAWAAPDGGKDAAVATSDAAAQGDAAPAGAEPTARVLMLAGTQEEKPSIDPRIAHVHQLKRPPLSTYNTYKLLDDRVVKLARAPVTQTLADGTSIRLTLLGVVEPRHEDGHRRARVRVERMSGDAGRVDKIEVTVGQRDNVFVGGQGHGRGAVFLSLTVTIPPSFQL